MMRCRNPYVSNGRAFGCGQCIACRADRRRQWTHRIMLESLMHSSNSFVTLTYDPWNLVTSSGYGLNGQEVVRSTLVRSHLTGFLKRFREEIRPRLIRYYAVGEYGPKTERPHYHLAMFNAPGCQRGLTRLDYGSCCRTCDMYSRAWGHGAVQVGILTPESASYVAGYVTKKLIGGDADGWLQGREPEFQAISNGGGKAGGNDPHFKGGIGFPALYELCATLFRDQINCEVDVPGVLRHGGKKYPLGRYLRGKLRLMVGRDEEAPEGTLAEMEAEMRPLREIAFNNSRSFKNEVIDAGTGKYLQLVAKQQIWKNRRVL